MLEGGGVRGRSRIKSSVFFYLFLIIYCQLLWVFTDAGSLSLVAGEQGYCLVLVHRLLTVVASLVAAGAL